MSPQHPTIVYLGLGSNIDDPPRQLAAAVAAIERLPSTNLLRRSPVYASKPWGKLDQPDFLNMVVEIETNLSPHTLLRHCKHIEAEQGRTEGERWGPRPVDIDILIFGNRTIRTASLVVPHPRMWDRAFVLRPLGDLKPGIASPQGRQINSLLSQPELAAQEVWRYEPAGKTISNET